VSKQITPFLLRSLPCLRHHGRSAQLFFSIPPDLRLLRSPFSNFLILLYNHTWSFLKTLSPLFFLDDPRNRFHFSRSILPPPEKLLLYGTPFRWSRKLSFRLFSFVPFASPPPNQCVRNEQRFYLHCQGPSRSQSACFIPFKPPRVFFPQGPPPTFQLFRICNDFNPSTTSLYPRSRLCFPGVLARCTESVAPVCGRLFVSYRYPSNPLFAYSPLELLPFHLFPPPTPCLLQVLNKPAGGGGVWDRLAMAFFSTCHFPDKERAFSFFLAALMLLFSFSDPFCAASVSRMHLDDTPPALSRRPRHPKAAFLAPYHGSLLKPQLRRTAIVPPPPSSQRLSPRPSPRYSFYLLPPARTSGQIKHFLQWRSACFSIRLSHYRFHYWSIARFFRKPR